MKHSESPSAIEAIIIQAMIELKNDLQQYGPFELQISYQGKTEKVKLFFDRILVLTADVEDDQQVTLIYWRDTESLLWAEELCRLADAHARMKG